MSDIPNTVSNKAVITLPLNFLSGLTIQQVTA